MIYPAEQLPDPIKYQLLAYVRVEWWWVFQGKNRLWDYTRKSTHPVYAVIVEQDVLIAHAEVNWRWLEHGGKRYKVYGLSAVYVAPSFRKEGFGKMVVREATDWIKQQPDADISMLFCLPELKGFYESCGWTLMDKTPVHYGAAENPTLLDDELLMMLFMSSSLTGFENTPVYVGGFTW